MPTMDTTKACRNRQQLQGCKDERPPSYLAVWWRCLSVITMGIKARRAARGGRGARTIDQVGKPSPGKTEEAKSEIDSNATSTEEYRARRQTKHSNQNSKDILSKYLQFSAFQSGNHASCQHRQLAMPNNAQLAFIMITFFLKWMGSCLHLRCPPRN